MSGYSAIHFGSSIRALRMELGLTQIEFAERLGVTQAQVSKWEISPQPNVNTLSKIAEVFGRTIRIAFEKEKLA